MSDQPNLSPATAEGADTTATDDSLLTAADTTNDTAVQAAADVAGSDTGTADSNDTVSEDADGGVQSAPETYADFTLPEGVEMDAEFLAEAAPVFKELNLTQEQAQKLVDLEAARVQAGQQAQAEAFSQLMDSWKQSSLKDKEFGGDKFNENIALARSALDKFGTSELKQLLEDHGVGNHPEMIRFMVKVGQLTAEDRPGAASGPTVPEKDRVAILYGTA